MLYTEVVATIENKRRFGKMCGRDVMIALLPLFLHPESGMNIIHIAGTNGKGSTAAALAQILMDQGFKVGLFTSPHLVTFRERIRVNGEMISEEDVVRIGTEILERDFKSIETTIQGARVHGIEDTMFDDSLLMALLYFKEEKCDYVILETGLGGRMDSTAGLSVVPKLSIITRIGLDHTGVLGDTIGQIAGEKAGILKAGTHLVLAENEPEAVNVILEAAEKLDVPAVYVGDNARNNLTAQAEHILMNAQPSLVGPFQHENLKTAVVAALLLAEMDGWSERDNNAKLTADDNRNALPGGLNVLQQQICKSLSRVEWAGRMQILSQDPFLMVDGAHNPQGIHALHESLVSLYGDEHYIFVTGVLRDKDFEPMVQEMAPLADEVYTVTVDNPRALFAEELAQIYRKTAPDVKAMERTADALALALASAKKSGKKVVAFGSLYFVGEVMAAVGRE